MDGEDTRLILLCVMLHVLPKACNSQTKLDNEALEIVLLWVRLCCVCGGVQVETNYQLKAMIDLG